MSEANKLLAREWFEQVWNRQDATAIDRLLRSDGLAYGFPSADAAVGIDDFKAAHQTFCGAFPDIRIDVEDVVAEGDRVAIRWKANMTHRGDHLGIPASGKTATLHGSSFIVVEGGKIRVGWNYMDMEAMMKSLSAV